MPPIEEAQAIHRQRVGALRGVLSAVPLDGPSLTLEIGCGHGHYMTAYAAAHPEERCIAIDIIQERLDKSQRKSERAGLANVSWIRADAQDFLEALPPKTRFDGRILVLFPDPWPKRKHWKNRLIQPPFLSELAKFTATGTPLCFRTDHRGYFAQAFAHVDAHPDWQVMTDAPWPFEQQTIFEARADSHQSWIARRAG
jgi:tRNA (guanine-N7-)-methyltransferase